uniref:Uncharacterized protein n=1 Tax=Oryza glumipatula TaxID=40148 RepID=A0A0E0AWA7_9ORYZ
MPPVFTRWPCTIAQVQANTGAIKLQNPRRHLIWLSYTNTAHGCRQLGIDLGGAVPMSAMSAPCEHQSCRPPAAQSRPGRRLGGLQEEAGRHPRAAAPPRVPLEQAAPAFRGQLGHQSPAARAAGFLDPCSDIHDRNGAFWCSAQRGPPRGRSSRHRHHRIVPPCDGSGGKNRRFRMRSATFLCDGGGVVWNTASSASSSRGGDGGGGAFLFLLWRGASATSGGGGVWTSTFSAAAALPFSPRAFLLGRGASGTCSAGAVSFTSPWESRR